MYIHVFFKLRITNAISSYWNRLKFTVHNSKVLIIIDYYDGSDNVIKKM